jgi:hypothetical protein
MPINQNQSLVKSNKTNKKSKQNDRKIEKELYGTNANSENEHKTGSEKISMNKKEEI